MDSPRTNRDLYRFVARLLEKHKETNRTLKEYLLALWSLARQRKDDKGLALDDFARMIEEAYTIPIPESVPAKPIPESSEISPEAGFEEWEQTILSQITLLQGMKSNGTLENKWRSFGVQAPDGGSWYNFDPLTYVECGAEGAFGGWVPEDETGRQLVSGKVAVFEEDGEVASVDPQDMERPVVEIWSISWSDFIRFLQCGRYYE